MRKEKRFESSIMNYPPLTNWSRNPETVIERAEARVRKILAEAPQESVLPAEIGRELDNLMAAARKQFA